MRAEKQNIISEGNTNTYLFIGIISLTVSLVFIVFDQFLGIFLTIFSLSILTIKSGFEIDVLKKHFRSYGNYFGYRFGTWQEFPAEIIEAHLIMRVEALSYKSQTGNVRRSKEIYYPIFLYKQEGKILLYEFHSYDNAKKALILLHDNFEIPVRNMVAEKLHENKMRRKTR